MTHITDIFLVRKYLLFSELRVIIETENSVFKAKMNYDAVSSLYERWHDQASSDTINEDLYMKCIYLQLTYRSI